MPSKWISEIEAVVTNGLYGLCADADAMARVRMALQLVESVLEDHREAGDLLTSSTVGRLSDAHDLLDEALGSMSSAHDHLLEQVLSAASARPHPKSGGRPSDDSRKP